MWEEAVWKTFAFCSRLTHTYTQTHMNTNIYHISYDFYKIYISDSLKNRSKEAKFDVEYEISLKVAQIYFIHKPHNILW